MAAAAQLLGGSGGSGGGDEPVIVPTLRQDLQLLDSWCTRSGEPTWLIFDPLRDQYFRIGRTFFILLSYWKLANLDAIKIAAQSRLKREIDSEEIGSFVKFLLANQLTDVSAQKGYQEIFERVKAAKKSVFSMALHGYLFFKIPLFRPDRFLTLAWPFVGFFFTRFALCLIMVLGVMGLYLVSRQWSAFTDNFINLLSFDGAILYGLSLILVKVCHELGHAFMAHRYGLKVSVIGVAFLVLMPIMYTDTSNAWRLTSKRKRLMVDGAGIMVELCLACIATILWVFVPDGGVRSTLFSIAAVSWTLSLLVNLNPFMRFDGYFILSDFLEVENLQARGFALARWRLREVLFNLKDPVPESVSPSLRRTLVWHAWGTWIYRFFLFLGIALLVYTFFIKVVAIVLFVVEILWFICFPVFRELKEWWMMRDRIIKSKRSMLTMSIAAGIGLALFMPISSTVSVVGVVHADREVNVYAPFPAKLIELNVTDRAYVKKDEVLAVFESEELELKASLLEKKVALLRQRIDRGAADFVDGANRLVLESELAGEVEELKNLSMQRERLVLRAEIEGVVADLSTAIHTGRYIDQSSPLFRLLSPSGVGVVGLVNEVHLERLKPGSSATFYPDDLMLEALPVTLKKINASSTRALSFPSMAIKFGGTVPTQPAASPASPEEVMGSFYGLEFSPVATSGFGYDRTQRGVLHLDAEPQSLASRAIERVISVAIRETGF